MALIFSPDVGASVALKLSTVDRMSVSAPRFHLLLVALPTSITTSSVPSGTTAFTSAVRGISAFVDCDKLLKTISKYLYGPSISDFFTLTSVGAPESGHNQLAVPPKFGASRQVHKVHPKGASPLRGGRGQLKNAPLPVVRVPSIVFAWPADRDRTPRSGESERGPQ